MYVYDPKELAAIPRLGRDQARAPGAVAARCFELLREGTPLDEIVIDLRETPEKVTELREQWLDMGGAAFVVSPTARAVLEKIVGPFANIAELIERVTVLAAR